LRGGLWLSLRRGAGTRARIVRSALVARAIITGFSLRFEGADVLREVVDEARDVVGVVDLNASERELEIG
jgi:hypothetical protein